MNIKEVLKIAKEKRFGDRASLESEILLSRILGKNRVFLHLYDDFAISKNILNTLLEQIELLNNNYPIEYITKQVSFFSQDFFIDEGALIPRPESEILVSKALDLILQHKIKHIFEIGVGSGVVSIMLCLMNKDLKITATDLSKDALNIAKKNIQLKSSIDKSLESRILLVETNLLDGVNRNKNDLIISNPPYIKNSYKIPQNLHFEPKMALFGGEFGDEILKKIIDLNPEFLCCEIGYDQENINKYLSKNYKNVEFYKDYSNFTRGFVAQK